MTRKRSFKTKLIRLIFIYLLPFSPFALGSYVRYIPKDDVTRGDLDDLTEW